MQDYEIRVAGGYNVNYWYSHPEEVLNINLKKESKKMVDIEKIKAEIEALKNLDAVEYCKEQVEKLYADFEASRESEIAKLESALAVFEKYQVEETEEEEQEEEVIETASQY